MDFHDYTSALSGDKGNPLQPTLAAEETLVTDSRAELTPAQMVEQKLASLLQSTPLPVSRLHTAATRRALS